MCISFRLTILVRCIIKLVVRFYTKVLFPISHTLYHCSHRLGFLLGLLWGYSTPLLFFLHPILCPICFVTVPFGLLMYTLWSGLKFSDHWRILRLTPVPMNEGPATEA